MTSHQISGMINPHNSNMIMETFTIEEFQEDFDNLLERVETGESFVITSEYGNAVLIPYAEYKEVDELVKCLCDHDDGC